MVVSAHYAICAFAQRGVRKFSRIRHVDLTAHKEDVPLEIMQISVDIIYTLESREVLSFNLYGYVEN